MSRVHTRAGAIFFPWIIVVPLLASCGTPISSHDAGDTGTADHVISPPADAHVCRADTDCDDHVFCNGVERCMPGAPAANALGCVPPTSAFACQPTQLCDEANARCLTQCGMSPDADGDGHRSRACGGDDCDDADANRFPGNTEVCDSSHDEDCDLSTVGAHDDDGDTETWDQCCNRPTGALPVCGTDCNDMDRTINTRAPEVCDHVDNNCNGQTDEGVQRTFFPDVDRDNFGDSHATHPTLDCAPTVGLVENALDCDDNNPLVNPAAPEICDGLDNNCNATVDEEPSAGLYCAMSYGTPPNTTFGCTTDSGAMTGACTISSCRTGFGDCDAQLANGCETDLMNSPIHCGACGTVCGAGGTCTMGVCDPFTNVAVGAGYGCAARASGIVVCWGNNDFGQLGDGTAVTSTTPVVAARFPGVNSIAAGRFALRSPGYPLEAGCPATCVQNANSLQCWGCNATAQTGIGVASGSILTPSPVMNFPAFDPGGWALDLVQPEISVGAGHACGWQMNPNAFPVLFCWGRNNYGQVTPGATSTTPVSTPVAIQVSTNHDSLSIAAGGRHTCVSTTTPMRGLVSCWGDNTYGQRGPSAPGTNGIAYVSVPTGEMFGDWAEVVAGDLFTCGRLQTSHHVACWGLNDFGQLGDGSTVASRAAPGIVPGISTAAQLAADTNAVCMRNSSGGVKCWGSGYGSTPQTIPGLTDATQIAMGDGTACAVRAVGTVVCWSGVTTPVRLPGTGNW